MRLLPIALFALLGSCTAFGQTYTVSTFAGGGLPVNISGLSAKLPSPSGVTSVAVDPSGNIFLAVGGVNGGYSVVLRLDASTSVLKLVAGNGTPGFSGDNGPATDAQLDSPTSIAVDGSGNLFIADSLNNRIREVSNGVIITVAGSGSTGIGLAGFGGDNGPATSAQLNFPNSVALDSAGNIYIADSSNQRVRKVSNGVITTVAGNGTQGFSGDNGPAASAQLTSPTGVALDSANNLYIADSANNRIRKVSNGVITTVAGTGVYGSSGDGGPATSAQLNSPSGVYVDSIGNIYVVCQDRIRNVSGGVIATVAGGGSSLGDNGPATSTLLGPAGVSVDSGGNLYIADNYNERIRKVSKGIITTVIGGGSSLGDNAPAAGAQMYFPWGAAVDSARNLYIADSGNNLVRKVSNNIITTVAGDVGNVFGGFSGDSGPATSAQLQNPSGVAVDSVGNLYVADTGNERIRMISNGVVTTVAGNGTLGFSGDNGPATSAQLAVPYGIAVDSAGALYIADYSNQRIRKVSNGIITTVAGNGVPGFSGDNGPATSARLSYPTDVYVDNAGTVYIADRGNSRVRRISDGIITTVAGNGTQGFSGDNGPATSAEINLPTSVAVDSVGTLYIADEGNNRVRRVSGGVITTVAGDGTPSFGGDNGPAASAKIHAPTGLTLDSAGNVYVADNMNHRIRVLTPSSATCAYSVTPGSLQAPVSGGNFNFTIQTIASCSWTVSGLPKWVTASGASFGSGPGTVTLLVTPNNSTAALTWMISIAGVSVTITQPAAAPSIYVGGIVNAASYAAGMPLTPGSIATAYGSFLLTAPVSATGSLPTSLAGLSLQFSTGFQAPLFFADVGQVNFQVPWELAGQSQSSLAATLNGQVGAGQAVNLAPFLPGIFSTNGQGTGQGAILNRSYLLVNSSNPAIAGTDVVQIYCTGLGAVTNQPHTGSPTPASTFSLTTGTPTVTIGGAQATVMFSGLAPGFVGLYQVNALVPASSSKGAMVPVTMSIGGATSNMVTIAVK